MEFMRVYEASNDPSNNMEPLVIDRDYYMKHSIIGILARFISYYPEYQPETEYDLSTKKGYEDFDKYCVKKSFDNTFSYLANLLLHQSIN